MWAAKLIIALLMFGIAVWLARKAWFIAYPDKALNNLESRLVSNLKKKHAAKSLLGNWSELCTFIKNSVVEQKPALISRGTEIVKLFVGEYFRNGIYNRRLTAAIYRDLANLYAVLSANHQENAKDIVVALRVAARESAGNNEAVFNDIIQQFTLYGLLAMRDRKTFVTAQMLDQLFLLIPKCTGDGMTSQMDTLLAAIGTFGQAAVKRHEVGLTREIAARLLQLQETQGRKIHEPLYAILLKSVRTGSAETVDIVMEVSKHILMTEDEQNARKTMRIWAEAAKSALIKHDDRMVSKIIAYFTQAVEESLPQELLVKMALDEIFEVMSQVLPNRDVAKHGGLLLPVIELGCYCMQRELMSTVSVAVLEAHRSTMKNVLDKLLYLGALVTRSTQVTTGEWVTNIFQQWSELPNKGARKDDMRKFVQLWLLYWTNKQRRSARQQGGIPAELTSHHGLTQEELARFTDINILPK